MLASAAETDQAPGRSLFATLRGTAGPLVGLILLCVLLSLATDTFLSVRNALNILDQVTVLGVMAIGMTFVILIGGIDLSVGSGLALAMIGMGWLRNVGVCAPRRRADAPPPPPVLAGGGGGGGGGGGSPPPPPPPPPPSFPRAPRDD